MQQDPGTVVEPQLAHQEKQFSQGNKNETGLFCVGAVKVIGILIVIYLQRKTSTQMTPMLFTLTI